jgi:flavin reductase (DIM6/NTAB) family NADH-FMN oxidoreductase RutF
MFYEASGPHGLRHNPFKSLVVPRPIGWISTQSRSGVVNLAPFSFFNAMAEAPPIVVFGANGSHADGGVKDTLANIEETGEFVCNLATWELRHEMNRSSAQVGRGVDEMELAGLERAPSRIVKPPRVASAPAHLECRHMKTVELPSKGKGAGNHVVFGEVVGVHISDEIINDGILDMTRFRPIARLGYHDYAVVTEVFTMRRPE